MNTRHSSERGSAVAPPPLAWVARLLGWMGEAFRLAERSIGPIVDLLIRLRLAQIFFVSGVLKAADFEHAIYLSTHEYPVSWMDPVMAAYLGVAIELGGSVLLVDESADEKAGDNSAGAGKQYNGRLGKIETSQVGVLLSAAFHK